MTLSITDPAFLFPGISLLFLAYTNRYLALANVIRALNHSVDEHHSENLIEQIQSLHMRITLIKYMQAFGVVAFLFCVMAMLSLMWQQQIAGEILFVSSLASMFVSLLLSLTEVLKSGQSLKIELDRTQVRKQRKKNAG